MSLSSVAEGTPHTSTFRIDNYTVVVSLNDEFIYLQITHREACVCYEANVDQTDLRFSFDLQVVYRLLCACFSRQEGHSVDLVVNGSSMVVKFQALFGGYLPIVTEVVLREKEQTDDGKLAAEVIHLKDRVTELEENNRGLQEANQELESLVDLKARENQTLLHQMERMKERVTELEEDKQKVEGGNEPLRIEGMDARYMTLHGYRDTRLIMQGYSTATNLRMANISSHSLESLSIVYCHSLTSLEGIQELPNLKRLTLLNCSQLSYVVDILKSYSHYIEEMVVSNCPLIKHTVLSIYCSNKRIKLMRC